MSTINQYYIAPQVFKWTKGCILPYPKKFDLGITKNYRDITLTFITAKVYNALLLNHIKLEIKKKFLGRINCFWRNQSTTTDSDYLWNHRKKYLQKILRQYNFL